MALVTERTHWLATAPWQPKPRDIWLKIPIGPVDSVVRHHDLLEKWTINSLSDPTQLFSASLQTVEMSGSVRLDRSRGRVGDAHFLHRNGLGNELKMVSDGRHQAP